MTKPKKYYVVNQDYKHHVLDLEPDRVFGVHVLYEINDNSLVKIPEELRKICPTTGEDLFDALNAEQTSLFGESVPEITQREFEQIVDEPTVDEPTVDEPTVEKTIVDTP